MSPKPSPIKVFLVDDHPIVREGVRAFLENNSLAVIGEAAGAKECLRKVAKLDPDVVILDVNMPAIDGGELARRLRRLAPRTKLVAFSIHSSEEYVVKMARCGVHGYVTKNEPAAHLLDVIRQVHAGSLHFPPGMTDAILTPGTPSAVGPATAKGALTARELEVLTLLADGHTNKGVAAKLGIAVRTAETHRENLTAKLGIFTVAGLTKYAISRDLTSL